VCISTQRLLHFESALSRQTVHIKQHSPGAPPSPRFCFCG
jgi:hypothetical protein